MNRKHNKILDRYQKNFFYFEDKFFLFLYSSYFILKPFYFWSSGLPQISDFLFVFLIVMFLIAKRNYLFKSNKNKIIIAVSLFVFYSVIVNLFWSIFLSTSDMLLSSVYLIFNFFVFTLVLLMLKIYGKKMIKVTFYSSFVSIIIQIIYLITQGGFLGTRNTGTFNNPNQLGYYALLMTSFIILCSTQSHISISFVLIGLISGLILTFTSLSKAAIISCLGVIVVYIIRNLLSKKTALKMASILVLFFGVSYFVDSTTDFFQENQLLELVDYRITSIGNDSDDSLEGRGYDRIFNYPEYWVFGAGEGEYYRFSGWLRGSELHSTLGNIQVSYGFIGLFLFFLILHLVLKINGYQFFYIIFFILVYGLTHNGLRNSLFWILIGIMGSIISGRDDSKIQ